MDTVQEIQERHDTLIDIERSPNELHQLFLDMTVLVQSQGKQLNDIQSQFVCLRWVHPFQFARKHQMNTASPPSLPS
ncbi:hypothetical protein S83_071746 [Arachis hypogaea]